MRNRVAATAIGLVVLLLAGSPTWGAQVLFHASFDKTLEPEQSSGNPGTRTSDTGKQPRFIPGIAGQGVVVGARSWVTYNVGGNLRPEKGSISFLAKPIGWSGGDSLFHPFVVARARSGDWLLIYKVPEHKLEFTGGTAASYSFAEAPAENWHDGQWKHICVTWVKDDAALYVDGALAGKAKWPVVARSFGEEFTIGGTIFGESSGEQAMDELTAWDEALSKDEVAAEFAKFKTAIEKANAAGAETAATTKQAGAAVEAPPLLRACFNGKLDAEVAAGGGKGTASGKVAFTGGLRGKAVLLGRDTSVAFPLAGNVNPMAGTISFWVKPVGWSGSDGQWHYMVRLAGDDDWIMLQTVNNSLELLGGNRKEYGETTTPIADWPDGVWRFVTVTWDTGRNRLYLDGRPASEEMTWPRVPVNLGENIVLGGQLHGESKGHIAIQDFEVRGGSLSPEQVQALYTASVQSIPALRSQQEFAEKQKTIDPRNIATPAYGAILLPSSQGESSMASQIEQACDGNFDTRWLSAAGTYPNWVEVRWAQPVTVNKLIVNESPLQRTGQYGVDVYREGKWQTVVETKPNTRKPGEQIVETFGPVEVIKLRYIMLAPAAGVEAKAACSSISELQVCSAEPMPDLSKVAKRAWKSNWIWYPEETPSDVARYFRKHFTVDDPAAVKRAVLQIGADDSYEAYVNGQHVGSGGIPTDRHEVQKYLKRGDNVLAVKAHNLSGFAGMIAELALIGEDGATTRVLSDGTWKAAKEETKDWSKPAAEESTWVPAAELGVPPNSPDHKDQPYYAEGGRDVFEFGGVMVTPSEARPGQSVQVTAEVSSPRKVDSDYAFAARVGEKKVSLFADFTVASKTFLPEEPTSRWKPGEKHTITTKVYLPEWAPNGAIPLFLTAVGPDAQVKAARKAEGAGAVGQVNIKRFGVEPKPWPAEPPKAEVRQENGHPTLFVNGKVLPPQLLTENSYASYEAFGEQAKTGIHFWRIFAARGRDSKFYMDDKPRERAELCAVFDQHIANLLKVDPEAYIVVGTTFNVSQEWTDRYPDDATVLADGRRVQHSFSSRRWIAEVKGDVDAIVKHLMSQPYSGHVVGFHFGIGAGPETYYWGLSANSNQTPRDKLVIGDYSPEHIRAFRQWLRDRYGGDEKALQAAWKDSSVTFDTAKPDVDVLRREDLFTFRDPARTRMPQDYWEFHSDVMADRVIDIGSAIKQASGGKYLTGFWGLYSNGMNALSNSPGKMQHSAYGGIQKVLESPAIDYFAILQEYLNVRWGTPMVPDNLTQSIRRHNKFCLIEYDMRTFFTPLEFTERTFSQPETLSVIRRDVAAAAVRGDACWWVGFPQGTTGRLSVPWFAEDSIVEALEAGRRVYDACYGQDLRSVSQIAVFMNNADMYTLDVMNGHPVLGAAQYNTWANELTKVGAPFDQFHLDDVSLPGMDRYKVYFFLNAWNLNEKQRQSIRDLLAKPGKTAVWLYAPGFCDGSKLSTEGIESVTGFKVALEPREGLPEVEIEPGHSMTAGIEKGHRIRPRPYQHHIGPFEFGPIFDITDPAAEVLGRYADSGKAACAHKKVGSGHSVYLAIPYIDAALARSICRASGVHLYADEDVYLDATGHLLTITATSAGYRSAIKLPARGAVYDVFGGREVARDAGSFRADVPPLSTSLYYIGSEAEMKSFVESLQAR